MKEFVEFRIYKKYAHLLLSQNEGRDLGQYIVIEIPADDDRLLKVKRLNEEIKSKYNDFFFLYSEVKRKYSRKEIEGAGLLHLRIKKTFEPSGEECGTLYDEVSACKICGANRKQVTPLKLKKGTIPNLDIAKTIGGEVVVSSKFAVAVTKWGLKGISLKPVVFGNGESGFYQLEALSEVELTTKTLVGINSFDLSTECEGEVYKCPCGVSIGLNLLSEPHIIKSSLRNDYDFMVSKQRIGLKRGLLRPEPLYFCSQNFRKMIDHEKINGFNFEIARVEKHT